MCLWRKGYCTEEGNCKYLYSDETFKFDILWKLVCVSNSSVGKDILVDVDMIREAVVFAENLAYICMDRVEKLKIATAVKVRVW